MKQVTKQFENNIKVSNFSFQGKGVPQIKVLGIGGSGVNTVSRIAKADVVGVELIALNTDAQALKFCNVKTKVLIGKNSTNGLGAGMDDNLGRAAAVENKDEIHSILRGTDMAFITCGLCGGT